MKRWTVAAALAVGLGVPAAAWGAAAPPYHDLDSTGGLYLCDRAGHAVSGGSIDDRPFAWYAVSRKAAPAGYGNPGGSVTLYAAQPRKDVYPDRWNTDTMTGASTYAAGSAPTAVATGHDFSLRDFLDEFPATWDGAVELRMYFGSRANGYDGRDYVSADVKVAGNRWTLLSDPTGSCPAQPKAQSVEVTVNHINPTALPTAQPGASGMPSGVKAPGAASLDRRTTSGATTHDVADAAVSRPARRSTGWGDVLPLATALVAGTGVASAGLTLLRRRRTRA